MTIHWISAWMVPGRAVGPLSCWSIFRYLWQLVHMVNVFLVYTQLQKKVYAKQIWVLGKMPSGSKVLNQDLRVCTLSASNKEVNGRNRFLCTFLHSIPANFTLELWNHLEFLQKLWLDCLGTLIGCPSKLLGVQLRLHSKYSLGNKVYTFFWSRV